jgi:hypothetical protein
MQSQLTLYGGYRIHTKRSMLEKGDLASIDLFKKHYEQTGIIERRAKVGKHVE